LKDFYFDDSGSGFSTTTNMNGLSYDRIATGNDVLYLGDLRSNLNGVGLAQVLFYDTALTDQQVADIATWMSVNPNAVPEPSALLLAAIGLLGLAAFRWRRK